ncbi:MAG: hypothetical protein A2046_13605 [Bacteroidetes bacterium GWA2_30_7]|nr:MAG: hypothetical protein A2046_13605 [Bacteroidetes bacterium GWA2_30_7]
MSFFTHPIADDFTYSLKGKAYGILEVLKYEYLHWNGRYSSNLFVILNPIVFNSLIGYKLVPVFSIIFTIFSLYFFLSSITAIFNKIEKLNYSLFITLLYIYQMPVISEGIYWFTGFVTYHLGNILFLFLVSLIFRYLKNQFIFNKYSHAFIIISLLFIITGLNEVIMLNLLFLCTLTLFITYRNKQANRNFFILLFIFTLIFSSFVYFAPGNSTRESLFSNNHNLVSSLINSTIQTFRFIFEWISSLPLIIMSVFYYFINRQLSDKEVIFKNSFYLKPSYSIIIIFIVVFICIFPAYWATGILGQQRSVNVAYFLFIIFWFINLTVFFNYFKAQSVGFNELRAEIKIFAVLIMLISFAITKNGLSLISDIAYNKQIQYNNIMNKRFQTLSNFDKNNTDTIYFEQIPNPSKTIFILDITDDSECWMNKGYNAYFEIENKIVAR